MLRAIFCSGKVISKTYNKIQNSVNTVYFEGVRTVLNIKVEKNWTIMIKEILISEEYSVLSVVAEVCTKKVMIKWEDLCDNDVI